MERPPDAAVAWRSAQSARNDGSVPVKPLDPNRTSVELSIDVEPEGRRWRPRGAHVMDRQVGGGLLARFRDYVEAHGASAGGRRGRATGDEAKDRERWAVAGRRA